MNWILGIGAIVIGIYQIFVSKQYFNNIRQQSSPLIFALIALIFSLLFAVFLIGFGIMSLTGLR